MKNPIRIFENLVPDIISGNKHVIISTIETPSTDFTDDEKKRYKHFYKTRIPKNPVRICYYISALKGIHTHVIYGFLFKNEVFDTIQKEKKDPSLKYDIVGDFLKNPYFLNDPTLHIGAGYVRNTERILANKFIDTIVTVDKNYENPKIVYDRTGHLDIADEFRSKAKYQRRQRLLAEIAGDPRALMQQGIFDVDNQTEKQLSPEPPVNEFTRLRIFDFGKVSPRLKSLLADIKYLNSI
jgi:hypothetical protein